MSKKERNLKFTFEDWTIQKNDDDSISLTAKADGEKLELTELIDHISSLLDKSESSYNLSIKQNDILSIEVYPSDEEKPVSGKKFKRLYTSGCYDLFHYGHLNIFKRSKELCDYLIVGVSTDELIEKEKGKRPVIPYEERAKIVEAIKYVDEVIPQTDKNKQAIVDKYNIDAISVGDDWKGKYPPVTCEMVYFSYTKSVSSTILKDTLSLLDK